MRSFLLCSTLSRTVIAAQYLGVVDTALAQTSPSAEISQGKVVLTKLSPPIYPPLARQARITGDVKIQLRIRKDGGIESAEVVSGHAVLKQAALESAQQSQFECQGCGQALTA
jgi:TonB family protein